MKYTDDLVDRLLRSLGITRTRVAGDSRGRIRANEEQLVVAEDTETAVETARPKYELVALYGFSVNCPKTARLELNPKARREKGDLVFHLAEGFRLFVSWGSLEEAKRRYPTAAAQAAGSVDRSVKSTRAKLDGTPETRDLKIQDHDAVYTHARMFMDRGGFPFGSHRITQDAYAMHVHCENTERYYVIYTFTRPEASSEVEKIFEPIMSSFKCHSP